MSCRRIHWGVEIGKRQVEALAQAALGSIGSTFGAGWLA
jgi:hypothetical protein